MSRVRPLEDRDYEAYVAISNASYPEYGWTVAEARHEDSTWEGQSQFFKARFLLEDDARRTVGTLDLHHQRGRFDPHRYRCEVIVHPDHRRRGHGSALFDFAVALVRERGGKLLVGGAKESMSESVEFLAKRGCVERQRTWESRLDVNAFDFARFAGAEERVAAQGVGLTTLADELAREGEAALRKVFELEEICNRDIPSVDAPTAGDFDVFRAFVVGSPGSLTDACFLAAMADAYVGLSALYKDLTNAANLYQGLTAVHRAWRGKGVAMALKLQTVRYARAHGKREIRTWNDTRNRPMLRINEALGFAKQPVWIEFGKSV